MAVASPTLDQLGSATEAVDTLIDGIRDDQWSAPTPCTEWTVRDLIGHLVGMNRVFTALLRDQPLPQRGDHPLGDDPLGAFRDTSTALRAAFEQPGTLERAIVGPLGSATGASRLHWRISDLIVHAWDLAQATGQPLDLPTDLVEQVLAFVGDELPRQSRARRFDPAQDVAADAPAIDRLIAFSGRPVRPAYTEAAERTVP
jgi:uncharacterized protein (TIGR03086 family)